eukprot:9496750-Pyramimonas_sp.AAC.1
MPKAALQGVNPSRRRIVEGAKAAEAITTPAEDVAPGRRGGDDASDIPGAYPPTQSDGGVSSEDLPTLVGADDITTILMIFKDVSNMQFSRSRARKVLEKEKQLFHRWRDLRSRAQETEELVEHRIDVV